jgi:hypothetical protein
MGSGVERIAALPVPTGLPKLVGGTRRLDREEYRHPRQSASDPGDKSIGPFGCPMRILDQANSSFFRKFQDEKRQVS